MSCLKPYEPINRLKPIVEDLWIVDGPETRMRYFGLRLPFTTRMTIVRLPDGRLSVHSPTAPTAELLRDVGALGPVGFLVSPSRLHTTWLADWQHAWPEAVSAGVAAEPAWDGSRLTFGVDLGGAGPLPWSAAIAQVLVPGGMFSEAVFFHLPSRSLILTDLIENFELERVTCRWLRWLLRLTGPLHPHGTAPPDMRLSFRRHRPALRAAVAVMRGWAPERIILAHGKWYASDGLRELERAFRWVD
jgi:Domain of unknown function (DUF4336)